MKIGDNLKKIITIMLTITVLALPAIAKDRIWQEGKLIDITSETRTHGSIVNGTGVMVEDERVSYVIDDGKYIYTASHIYRRRDKPLLVTVKAKVKFAIEKSKFYIVDENGKEHELRLDKKALKEDPKES